MWLYTDVYLLVFLTEALNFSSSYSRYSSLTLGLVAHDCSMNVACSITVLRMVIYDNTITQMRC